MKHAKRIKKSYNGKISQAAGRTGWIKLVDEDCNKKAEMLLY